MIAITRALRESFRRALAFPRRRAMNARVLFELDVLNARLDDIVGLLSPVHVADECWRCAGCDSLRSRRGSNPRVNRKGERRACPLLPYASFRKET